MERRPSNSEVEQELDGLKFITKALSRFFRRDKKLKVPSVAADTGFMDAMPFSAWRGPAPSARQALEIENRQQ